MASKTGITLLGLGPGDPSLLTREAWEVLTQAPEVFLRTRQHPTVAGFPPELRLHSFDRLYQDGESFEAVYTEIVEQVLELGQRPQGVVYAVPGHPYVGEATSPEIARRARERGIPVRLVEGLSFLEVLFSALEIDPLPHTTLVDALELAALHHPPFPPSAPAVIAQIHSPAIASEVKITLMAQYPDEHPVQLVHNAGSPGVKVEHLKLFEIDRTRDIGLLTALYLPPLGGNTSLEAFQEIVAHLRAPDGCPWDREQTHQSLRPHLLEEAFEVLTALDADDPLAMREEFGDLLLQIVLHAQIAAEYGEFTLAEVISGIHDKIVQRHPHVFGELKLGDTAAVLQNWERMKAAEREAKGEQPTGLLDGVALALPALAQAEAYQKRAGRVGFDWPNLQGVMDKIEEELEEVRQAVSGEARAAEIGDLLFAVVNLARWYEVDAESALRETNQRFRRRFAFIEAAAAARERKLEDLTLDELNELWDESKL